MLQEGAGLDVNRHQPIAGVSQDLSNVANGRSPTAGNIAKGDEVMDTGPRPASFVHGLDVQGLRKEVAVTLE